MEAYPINSDLIALAGCLKSPISHLPSRTYRTVLTVTRRILSRRG
jgi:hypothetical protein